MDNLSFFDYVMLILNLVYANSYKLWRLDFSQIKYEDVSLVYIVGSFLALAVLARIVMVIVWRSRKDFMRKYSGSIEYQRSAVPFMPRFLRMFSKWLLFIPIFLQLISLGNPYFVEINKKTVRASGRIRAELRDASQSMEQLFPNTQITKAEMGEEKHLGFLKMREGSGDRVSFWEFASNPYLIQDFVANDEFYKVKVYNAPLIICIVGMSPPANDYDDESGQSGPVIRVPPNKYLVVPDGCGTAIDLPLQQIIKQFKTDPIASKVDPKTNKLPDRAILIVTDANVDSVPAAEMKEIQSMGIKLYVIWIPTAADEVPPKFLEEIGKYGGKYWDVRTPNALVEAYRAIDRLEPANYEEVSIESRKDLPDIFLFFSAIFLFIIIFVGLGSTIYIGKNP